MQQSRMRAVRNTSVSLRPAAWKDLAADQREKPCEKVVGEEHKVTVVYSLRKHP